MSKDLNDQHQADQLDGDPSKGATPVTVEVPRVLTVADLLRSAHSRAFTKKDRVVCGTGHYEIDRVTGGLKPGFVWVFGADTSWGKSSFLIMVADESIKLGRRVLIVSAEDSEQIYGDRLLVRRSRVCAERFREGKLQSDEKARLTEVLDKAEDSPVFFDARGRSAEWVAKRVRELVKEYGIDVVAFDYLQAFDNEKHQQDRRNQVSYIARILTDSVKASNAAGIIFSQITVSDGKSHPDKHSIRESRDVSNAAEVVMLGFTPEKPIVRKSDGQQLIGAGERCVLIDKCKDGPRGGLFAMKWDSKCACFDVTLSPDAQRYEEITGGEFDHFGEYP